MLRKRMLIGLGGCFLASGAVGLMAWRTWIAPAIPNNSGFREASQDARDRRCHKLAGAFYDFAVRIYFFTRSNKDGQVGYVYSNLIRLIALAPPCHRRPHE